MSQVKVKVRPNQTVRFPGICVHCAHPATESMQIKKRIGRVTRLIDVPLCAACSHVMRRRSGDEERWFKIGLFASSVIGMLVLAVSMFFTPVIWGMGLRFSVALLISLWVGTAVWLLCRHQQIRVSLPEKQAITKAARINTFSWRTTTFDFCNETFRDRFKIINESLLMDN